MESTEVYLMKKLFKRLKIVITILWIMLCFISIIWMFWDNLSAAMYALLNILGFVVSAVVCGLVFYKVTGWDAFQVAYSQKEANTDDK